MVKLSNITILFLAFVVLTILGSLAYLIHGYFNKNIVTRYHIIVSEERKRIRTHLHTIHQYNIHKQIKNISSIIHRLYINLSFLEDEEIDMYLDDSNKRDIDFLFTTVLGDIENLAWKYGEISNNGHFFKTTESEWLNITMATENVLNNTTMYVTNVFNAVMSVIHVNKTIILAAFE